MLYLKADCWVLWLIQGRSKLLLCCRYCAIAPRTRLEPCVSKTKKSGGPGAKRWLGSLYTEANELQIESIIRIESLPG